MSKNETGEIIERLVRIETRLSNGLCRDIEDHERRLRFLERSFWTAFGALAVLQVILKFVSFPTIGGH